MAMTLGIITIADLEVFYRVGVPDAERLQPQRLLLTLELERDLSVAARTDSISDTTDYFAITQHLKSLGNGREWRLIEALAGEIGGWVVREHGITRATVTVKKFIIPEARHVSVTLISESVAPR